VLAAFISLKQIKSCYRDHSTSRHKVFLKNHQILGTGNIYEYQVQAIFSREQMFMNSSIKQYIFLNETGARC